MRTGKCEKLGEILKQIWSTKAINHNRDFGRKLSEIWREVAGEEMARHTRVIRWARHSLFIEADSAALAQELELFHGNILREKLQELIGTPQVKNLRFLVGSFEAGRMKDEG